MTKVLDETHVSDLLEISKGNLEVVKNLTEEFRKSVQQFTNATEEAPVAPAPKLPSER